MSITNYNLLEQAVINYSKRRDASTLIPTFISLCENEIDKKLRLKSGEKIKKATLKTDDRYLNLPSDLLAVRKLQIHANGRENLMGYMAPMSLRIKNHRDTPRLYTISGDKIELECIPSGNFVVEIVYYKKLTPLTEQNITNNVLAEFPSLYLYGTLYQLYVWGRDEETATYYNQKFNELIDSANAEENKKRIGPVPAARYGGKIP